MKYLAGRDIICACLFISLIMTVHKLRNATISKALHNGILIVTKLRPLLPRFVT